MIGDDLIGLIREKAKYFFETKTIVHIVTFNGDFRNGLILEYSDNLLILQDKKIGEDPIFIKEIKKLEVFREVGK